MGCANILFGRMFAENFIKMKEIGPNALVHLLDQPLSGFKIPLEFEFSRTTQSEQCWHFFVLLQLEIS